MPRTGVASESTLKEAFFKQSVAWKHNIGHKVK